VQKEQNEQLLYIHFHKKKIPFLQEHPQKSCGLIPVSYYEKPGKKSFDVVYKKHKKTVVTSHTLRVVVGKYQKEQIHVSKSKVHPKGKKLHARIAKEYKEAIGIYNTKTKKLLVDQPFILPIDSKITSSFGKARLYNNSLKGYHGGTDFRAKIGTPIQASNDGRVVLVKKRFYSGGTVVIDHGKGIYTCYFHMSSFSCKKGAMVHKGDIIGLSGKSGRVTGPHLHFGVRLDGVLVDPLDFIEKFNTYIVKENR